MKKTINKKITITEVVKFLQGKTKEQKREILLNFFCKKEYEKKNKLH
jgi:hypothetical protein